MNIYEYKEIAIYHKHRYLMERRNEGETTDLFF